MTYVIKILIDTIPVGFKVHACVQSVLTFVASYVSMSVKVVHLLPPVEAIGFPFAYVVNQITLRSKGRVKLQSQTLFVPISLLERMRGREPLISLPILPTFDYVPVCGIIYCVALRVSTGATYRIRVTHFSRFLNKCCRSSVKMWQGVGGGVAVDLFSASDGNGTSAT